MAVASMMASKDDAIKVKSEDAFKTSENAFKISEAMVNTAYLQFT